ncbi:hypothetical protein [Chryseobacterium chendengshani]|uniref:hypothetical protein n=1 Tax=Chryseobacterium sp. LJ756 TaxID=2864113 RepID=UPI001C640FB9|nr:hypothetical protein [Chryseobacterium sp. LJ756]MBW7674166.1 hypothetical protein [Chryseobacterium sp. LJ756]
MKNLEEVDQRVYSNESDDLSQLIVVTIIKQNDSCANITSIVIKSLTNVLQIRNDLSILGFNYKRKKKLAPEIIVSEFVKDRYCILITDNTTQTGAFQILSICK